MSLCVTHVSTNKCLLRESNCKLKGSDLWCGVLWEGGFKLCGSQRGHHWTWGLSSRKSGSSSQQGQKVCSPRMHFGAPRTEAVAGLCSGCRGLKYLGTQCLSFLMAVWVANRGLSTGICDTHTHTHTALFFMEIKCIISLVYLVSIKPNKGSRVHVSEIKLTSWAFFSLQYNLICVLDC